MSKMRVIINSVGVVAIILASGYFIWNDLAIRGILEVRQIAGKNTPFISSPWPKERTGEIKLTKFGPALELTGESIFFPVNLSRSFEHLIVKAEVESTVSLDQVKFGIQRKPKLFLYRTIYPEHKKLSNGHVLLTAKFDLYDIDQTQKQINFLYLQEKLTRDKPTLLYNLDIRLERPPMNWREILAKIL